MQEQIERQSKSSRPRRSRSISRKDNPSPSRSSTPQPPGRSSADTNGGLLGPGHAKQSIDKSRALKMFKNNDPTQSGAGKDHQRSTSILSDGTKRTLVAFQDDEDDGVSLETRNSRPRPPAAGTPDTNPTPSRMKPINRISMT